MGGNLIKPPPTKCSNFYFLWLVFEKAYILGKLINVKRMPIYQDQNPKHCFIKKFNFDNCKFDILQSKHS